MNHTFRLEPATPQDAFHVALIMAEALGDDIMERFLSNGNTLPPQDLRRMELLTAVALRTDTLYTYRHCTLARNAQGEVAGGLIAYPGTDYLQRRDTTFSLVRELIRFDVEKMDPETLPHEYYLDSMAVWPQFRRQGLARRLIQHCIHQGHRLQRPVVLACAPHNAHAHRLYSSLGFKDHEHIFIFGEDYIRMVHQ